MYTALEDYERPTTYAVCTSNWKTMYIFCVHTAHVIDDRSSSAYKLVLNISRAK